MKALLLGLLGLSLLLSVPARAATFGTAPDEEIPPLRPPKPEIPATFWEQHSGKVIAGSALFVLVLGGAVAWLLRPRPRPPVPPAVRARQELAPLRHRQETGEVLSRISRILRRYVSDAFNLDEGELTTTDLSRAMAAHQQEVGPQLADNISAFLRACDERKFAPPAPHPPLNAADQAANLIESVETRRTQVGASVPASPLPDAKVGASVPASPLPPPPAKQPTDSQPSTLNSQLPQPPAKQPTDSQPSTLNSQPPPP